MYTYPFFIRYKITNGKIYVNKGMIKISIKLNYSLLNRVSKQEYT